MKLSVIVPAYNESKRITAPLDGLLAALDASAWAGSYEIVVVDDGSTDGTIDLVHRRLDPKIRCERYPDNRGKGHAVRVGMLAARGALRVFVDADGSTPPSSSAPCSRRSSAAKRT